MAIGWHLTIWITVVGLLSFASLAAWSLQGSTCVWLGGGGEGRGSGWGSGKEEKEIGVLVVGGGSWVVLACVGGGEWRWVERG